MFITVHMISFEDSRKVTTVIPLLSLNESTSGEASTTEGRPLNTTRRDNMVPKITETEATTPQSTTQELHTDGKDTKNIIMITSNNK